MRPMTVRLTTRGSRRWRRLTSFSFSHEARWLLVMVVILPLIGAFLALILPALLRALSLR